MAATASYWCHRCNRLIRVCDENTTAACPHCQSGFIEAVEPSSAPSSPESRLRSPINDRSDRRTSFGFRRSRRSNSDDRSPFNPVVLMRSPGGDDGGDGEGADRGYQLYYDEGAGSGLRPLPPSMSEFLLGSGFDRLLDQLGQLDTNRSENPPASKSAIELMPMIEIEDSHVSADLHCAICKEAFTLGTSAREMPCKHLYHSDCILPWLSIRNSCPICRHQLPGEACKARHSANETEPFGLTIWRLPGGGYAVGRYSGARNGGGERAFPVVYTEMDGEANGNANGSPRRIIWGSRRNGNNGRARFFSNIVSCLRRFMSLSTSSDSVLSAASS